jgi:glycosyltransferase involved in cell wall biosynthesis
MKVLYITLENLSLHKGSVVHVKEIVSGLRGLGHDVGLAACSADKSQKADRFYNLNFMTHPPLNSLKFEKQPHTISAMILFFYLFRILPQYDVLYVREFHVVLTTLLPRLIFKKKLLFEMNGIAHEEQGLKSHSLLNRALVLLIRKLENLATKYSDRIIAVTPQIASYLVRNFDCQLSKVKVVSNGVNTERFYPIAEKDLLAEWRRKLGIGQREMVIAFVGNLAPWQGIECLIEAAPLLLKEDRAIRFLIVGDGILKTALKAKANRLGLSDHFLFTGMVNHQLVPIYINIADICVLQKQRLKSGYSPIKLYEYMACGKPLVATRVEGLEFIEEDGIGRLVEPEDVVGLERALRDLIMAPQERIRMGQKGLQVVRERFSWELSITKIENILKEMA